VACVLQDKPIELGKTILIVDDDQAIRRFVSSILTQSGYQVIVAESAEDALQQSRAHQGTIHLLLSNIQMPGITGIELSTTLTVERPDLRVLLMSGFASGMLVLNEGWHFLHKPFIPSQLRDLVTGVLAPAAPTVDPNLNEHQA